MRIVRWILAAAIFAGGLAAAYFTCWMRYECDVVKKRAEDRLYREGTSDYARLLAARSVMGELSRCLEHDPSDYQTLFLLAAAAENSGRREQAVDLYRRALSYNERPEIYANIAVLQFDLRQPDEATRNMMRACVFDLNHSLRVAQPMQFEIQRAVADRQDRLQALAAKRSIRAQ